MNRQNVQKLALFLMGLEQRVKENQDFFKKLTAVYKSGLKTFKEDNIAPDGLSEKLSRLAENYDSVVVTYEERGTTIYIEADNKNVTMSTKQTEEIKASQAHNEALQLGNRDYYIKTGQADDLLKEIGILSRDGKVKNDMIRKYNQIDHFVELIDGMLKDLAEKYETINIIDCGCGKSYLSFVLNYYVKEILKKPCYFIGLDYSETVIDASRKIAKNLGYHNMEFRSMDIRNYASDRELHLAVSLHACDTATDEAIALGVRNNVKALVVVPCCHREFLNRYSFQPFEQILKHGILKARMADVLTDGMRALLLEALGYKVSVVEYISPLDTPKNLMIRAEKIYPPNRKALDEYKQLKQLLDVDPSLEKLI